MKHSVLDGLFQKISMVTGLEDVALHIIENGKLTPIYKIETEQLDIEGWKKGHADNPVYVEKEQSLREVFTYQKPVFVNDTKNDSRSANAFFLFGVDSILILPIKKIDTIAAIICVVSIGQLHNFTQEEISKCEELVTEFFLEKGCELIYEN